jgi:nucleotide-binding universal stress UspA family protein
LAKHEVAADLALCHGIVTDEILREAREGENDLVIIGAKPAGETLKQLLISQVMPDVVDQAPCSVLIVRPDKVFG